MERVEVSPPQACRTPLLVALPPVTLGVAATILVLLGLAGRNPFWPDHALTISEAALVRDRATVARWLDKGADPDATAAIRAGLVGPKAQSMPPVEAAILADRTEILDLLLSRGATVDEAHLCGWLALAARSESDEALEYFARNHPEGSRLCGNVR